MCRCVSLRGAMCMSAGNLRDWRHRTPWGIVTDACE